MLCCVSKMISDDQHVNVVMAVMVSSDGGTSGSSPGTCFRILLAWAGLGWAAVIGCFKAITSVLAVPAAAFVQRVAPLTGCVMVLVVLFPRPNIEIRTPDLSSALWLKRRGRGCSQAARSQSAVRAVPCLHHRPMVTTFPH